ncbi:MAG TPA: serine/threonine protein kinase [Gammaproteobacteria bacterium]|nr:serine/threonine protein kinase [Gammaproteobacteria bacterium]
MKHPISAIFALMLVSLQWHAPVFAAYKFPIWNPYEATVVGTPPDVSYKWGSPRKMKTETLKINFDKDLSGIPLAATFNIADLKLLFAKQEGPAPLIFVIAGTGASYNSPKVLFLLNTFFQAGYHVITISSPTKPPFMAAASSTNLPGLTPYDAEDLYKVMTHALKLVDDRIEITEKYVTGYSLGGIDSAFVGYLDTQRKEINFDKVLMINPPVNLYTSVSNLDNIIPNYRKKYPEATGKEIFDYVFDRLAKHFKHTGNVKFSAETMYDLQKGPYALPLDDVELLIGISFQFSSGDLAFTSDALNHTGWIIPADENFNPLSSDTSYWYKRSLRWQFLTYFDKMIVPWWQEQHPGDTRDDIIHKVSLYAIEDYLRNNPNIGVMTNSDDIILGPGDIEYLQEVMGDRATIYPHGGHCGNMEYVTNVTDMLDFFKN